MRLLGPGVVRHLSDVVIHRRPDKRREGPHEPGRLRTTGLKVLDVIALMASVLPEKKTESHGDWRG